MVASATGEGLQTISIAKEIMIAAPIDIAFECLLEELGPASEMGEGMPMPMVLEAWPGGRWFRDLGLNSGHLWGHVQVIKAPKLLEIAGPLFMSYPGVNHLQYRLIVDGVGTKLNFTHRGFGEIPAEHRDGVNEGWEYKLNRVAQLAEARAKSKK